MVSIGKRSANFLNLINCISNGKPEAAQPDVSSEPRGNIFQLKGASDRLVDPYLLRRYGKYLILLAIENQKDGSVIL